MPKIEQSGTYTNGYDKFYWAAGQDVSDVEFRTFHRVGGDTPAEIAEAHEEKVAPALAEAREQTADAAADIAAEQAAVPVENRAADAATHARGKKKGD